MLQRGQWHLILGPWHTLRTLHGCDTCALAGWFQLQSDNRTIDGKETVDRAGACVKNYQGAKYLPEDLLSHVISSAVCVAGPAATHERTIKKPIYDPFNSERDGGRSGRAGKFFIVLGVLFLMIILIGGLFVYLRKRTENVRTRRAHACRVCAELPKAFLSLNFMAYSVGWNAEVMARCYSRAS
jgi:hypothetical protein